MEERNIYMKCPYCNHEDREKEFNINENTAICPHCKGYFPYNEGDPEGVKVKKPILDYLRRSKGMKNLPKNKEKLSWREVFSDISFKQKTDGTVQIDVVSPNPSSQSISQTQPVSIAPANNIGEEVEVKEDTVGKKEKASKTTSNLLLGAIGAGKRSIWRSLFKKSSISVGDKVKNINTGQVGEVTEVDNDDIYVNLDDNKDVAIWHIDDVNVVNYNTPPDVTPTEFNISTSSKDKELEKEVKNTIGNGVKKWKIYKVGNLELIGSECEKYAAVSIEDNGDLIETLKIRKDGHSWSEIINQGLWMTKLDELSKKSSKSDKNEKCDENRE